MSTVFFLEWARSPFILLFLVLLLFPLTTLTAVFPVFPIVIIFLLAIFTSISLLVLVLMLLFLLLALTLTRCLPFLLNKLLFFTVLLSDLFFNLFLLYTLLFWLLRLFWLLWFMMLLLLYFDLMMRFNSRRTLDVFFLSLFQLLIKNFFPDFEGLNLSSKFQEPLMDFPFQMHLDSLLSIIDGLNGSTNLTNLDGLEYTFCCLTTANKLSPIRSTYFLCSLNLSTSSRQRAESSICPF